MRYSYSLAMQMLPFALCLLLSCKSKSKLESQNPADVENRIKQVENNLAGTIRIKGDSTWNIAERMKYYNIPAVSIAVIHNYKVEFAKAYGLADVSSNKPATTHTLFQAASISKSLNAIGMLKLVQDKKIDLYADINNYLTSWKFPYDTVSHNKKISLANLLSHTAGTTVHGFEGYEVGKILPTVIQILNGSSPANSAPIRSEFEPGLRSEYSGGGTTISQLILTDVTKQKYDSYQQQNVLSPFGMKESFYTEAAPPEKQSLLATGYRIDKKEVKGRYHNYPEQAAAGLWTNPSDLAKFVIEMQLSYQGKSNRVLSRETTKLMLTPYKNESAALGTFIQKSGGQTYFQHGGANEGYRCQYYGNLDTGDGVVVMVNSDNGMINQEIVNSVATVYHWKDFYKPIVKTTISVADSVLEKYVGSYQLSPEMILTISKDGNRLSGQATGQSSVLLFPEAENKFFPQTFEAQIEFLKGKGNLIEKLVIHQNGKNSDAKKIR